MVALKWDRVDQMDEFDEVERVGSRPRLYVSSDAARLPDRTPGGRVYGHREQRRWKFALRRAVAVLVIATLGALIWSAAQRLVAVASTGGGAVRFCATAAPAVGATAAAGPAGAPSCPQAYVATEGDTVWSIAVRFARGTDPRPLADRLEAEIGGGTLQPGQRLAVP
jgi:hypothetical protein